MVDALINIVAVIAIIAIGAFLIVVLSDLLISIIDGKNGIFFKRGNGKNNKEDELPQRPKMVKHAIEEEKPVIEQAPVQQIVYNQSNVDMEQAIKEEQQAQEKTEEFDFSTFEEEIVMPSQPKMAPVETVEEDMKDKYDAYINAITEQAINILAEENVQQKEESVDEVEEAVEEEVAEPEIMPAVSNEEIERYKAELEEQRKAYEALLNEKLEAEEKNKVLESEKEQLMLEKEELASVKEVLESEREKLSSINEQLETEKEMLKNALEQQSQAQEEDNLPAESLEELTARLEMLEERLKTNEKLLKANKKEYQPLYKIKKSLDSDTKKLRRKDASVAKQKVMLYGVNNFVDLDEEKAKQLNEELDHLEGLRLSVKHCEDVMNANKDRYPILEQTNKILTNTVADIKADIADVKAKIELIKSKNESDENADNAETNE